MPSARVNSIERVKSTQELYVVIESVSHPGQLNYQKYTNQQSQKKKHKAASLRDDGRNAMPTTAIIVKRNLKFNKSSYKFE